MAVPLTLSSVPAQTPYVQYIATASQTVFPYPFEITQDSDLVCLINGVQQATDGGYTLSGQGNTTGGFLTFTVGQTAGTIVTLYRNIVIARITQFAQNGTFFSANFNNEFNRIYLIMQQLQESLLPGGVGAFALMVPNSNSPPPTTLLTPSAYANKYLSFDSNGNPVPAVLTSSGSLTAAIIGGLTGPAIQSEINAGVTITDTTKPVGNLLRYGIVPNSSGAAAANGAILQTLWAASVSNGPKGLFYAPNTTGTDTYYFDLRFYQCRDGIHFDGQNCTLNFTTGSPAAGQPVFMAIRDFRFENATIQYTYDSGAVTLFLGGSRYNDGIGWPANPVAVNGILDQDTLLANGAPLQGNFLLRNLRISYNNSATSCINFIGGLRNVTVDGVWIDGANTAFGGIYYEYGFASLNSQPTHDYDWTSSHCSNMVWRNIVVTNTGTSASNFGVSANGAGDLQCENIYVNSSGAGMVFGSGEAFYFRVWAPDGQGGTGSLSVPRLISIRDILLLNVALGVQLVGASAVGGAYISTAINALGTPQKYQAQTDYLNLSLDGFRIYCDSAISSSGSSCTIRNGVIQGQGTATSGGIFLGEETIHATIEAVQILNCNGNAIRGNVPSTIWASKRPQFIRVANCFIAGNTTGVQLDYCQSAIVENNQIGYNTTYNIAAETTQTTGINVGANSSGNAIICRNNFVSVPGGGTAYSNIGPAQIIQNDLNSGNTSGSWVTQQPTTTSTGWGSSVGAAIINNYNITDAGGANSNTNKVVAYLITILKANGLMGA